MRRWIPALAALLLAAVTGCTPVGGSGGTSTAPGATPASASASPTPEAARVAVGDCTGPLSLDGASMTDVQPIACDQPHYYEAFATVPLTMAEHPGADELTKLAGTKCGAAFTKFVGVAPEYSRYTTAYLAPDASAWTVLAERALTCLVGSADGGLVGSAKGDVAIFPRKGQCTGPQDVPPLELTILDCKTSHHYEVYAEKKVDSSKAPTGKALDKLVESVCVAGFKSFVGRDAARSKYEYLYLIAPGSLWSKVADHRIVCSVGLAKGGIKGTLKGAKK